jgi:hypothetical protein
VAGYGSFNNALNVKKNFKNFDPRTGVSWRLNEKNVVRAGYGASTIPFPDNRYAFNYPVKQNYNGTSANGFQRQGSMAAGFPPPALLDIPADGIVPVTGSLLNGTWDVIPTTLREGTLHSWNAAYQRELPYRFTVDVAYVGNRGVNIVMDVDTNAGMVYGSATRAAAFRDVQSHGHLAHAYQRQQDAVQRAADEDRPPVEQRPARHQLLHLQQVDGLRERERRHRHADRLHYSWGRVELRPHAQLRQHGDLRAAVGTEQAVVERGRPRQHHRRLAD